MADKEYIERNSLIAEYDRVHEGPAGGARKLMVDAPAADVVEVVRCEKCKHYETSDWDGEILCGCNHPSGLKDVEPNAHCSYGERKE